jgi:molecular chaperone DnaK
MRRRARPCVTVPAAFTALQCDATARAARLAGFEEYPLLQEPIAAAIAYGAEAGVRDQRWLVFDLGGGTLDVAVVSTRDGSLNVLEHRGDNHLGGKDVDRALARTCARALPRGTVRAAARGRRRRRAQRDCCEGSRFIAEYAKIELTTADETIVSLIDLGDDREGRPIEAELPLTRARLESGVAAPLVERCMRLAGRGARGRARQGLGLRPRASRRRADADALRARRLAAHVGARVDSSLDPMTVVARGAAAYASTVERSASAGPLKVRAWPKA